MEGNDFLGRGIHFPVQVDKATGRVLMTEGAVGIKEAIYLILMTQKTERWLRPDFGSSLNSYTFMDTSLTMMNIMARELKDNLLSQEPRISNVSVNMDPKWESGCLFISVEYTIRAVNTRDNLVFPFYLEERYSNENDG